MGLNLSRASGGNLKRKSANLLTVCGCPCSIADSTTIYYTGTLSDISFCSCTEWNVCQTYSGSDWGKLTAVPSAIETTTGSSSITKCWDKETSPPSASGTQYTDSGCTIERTTCSNEETNLLVGCKDGDLDEFFVEAYVFGSGSPTLGGIFKTSTNLDICSASNLVLDNDLISSDCRSIPRIQSCGPLAGSYYMVVGYGGTLTLTAVSSP